MADPSPRRRHRQPPGAATAATAATAAAVATSAGAVAAASAAAASGACVALLLIAVRLVLLAVCLAHSGSSRRDMADKPNQSGSKEESEVSEVSELVRQLPKARNSAEIFSLFLEQVEKLFPLIMHASILLFPNDVKSANSNHGLSFNFSNNTGNNSSNNGSNGNNNNNSSNNSNSSSNSKNGNSNKNKQQLVSFPSPHDTIRQLVEKVLAFQSSNNLDWTNCCIFNLYKSRGPVVQSPPHWPVTCLATYHSGAVVSDILSTPDYARHGPHFLDWKALHEKGANSMVAVPMYNCKQVVGVLCLASSAKNAFERDNVVSLLASALAPYVTMLEYTTRKMEMQKLVNEIIAPLAAANQKDHGDNSSAEDLSLEDGKPGHNNDKAGKRSAGALKCPKNNSALNSQSVNYQKLTMSAATSPSSGSSSSSANATDNDDRQITRKREPAIGKHHALEFDQFGSSQDLDLDWGDFFFNLVSMCIVYVYFTKAAKENVETPIAILLCMGVAAFDIVLLLMRWLWFEQYIHYGSFVLYLFQIYRVVVVPVANTWMSWRVLHTMPYEPDLYIVLLLGVLLVLCVALGIQVRFFLHAPLQLVSVFFAAVSTSDICRTLYNRTPGVGCVGVISALQLSLGLLLPSLVVHCLDSRTGPTFMPHVQAKRWP